MSPASSTPTDATKGAGGALYRFLRSIPTWVLWLLVVVWSIPTRRSAGQLVPHP